MNGFFAVNLMTLLGILLFIGTASAEEARLLDRQPSRMLHQEHFNSGGNTQMTHAREMAMARMNKIEFQKAIQNLTAPNAFRAERPVVESQNSNRRTQ